jgi:hypothetical protein
MEIIVGEQVHGKYHPTYRSPRKISRMSGKQIYFTWGSSQLIITEIFAMFSSLAFLICFLLDFLLLLM